MLVSSGSSATHTLLQCVYLLPVLTFILTSYQECSFAIVKQWIKHYTDLAPVCLTRTNIVLVLNQECTLSVKQWIKHYTDLAPVCLTLTVIILVLNQECTLSVVRQWIKHYTDLAPLCLPLTSTSGHSDLVHGMLICRYTGLNTESLKLNEDFLYLDRNSNDPYVDERNRRGRGGMRGMGGRGRRWNNDRPGESVSQHLDCSGNAK